jgi:cysteine desulfurase
MNSAAPIYFDNNASTRLAPAVLDAMQASLEQCYGNPSSLHQAGAAAKQSLAVARRDVAALLGASAAEIVFTSGATESNHMALRGALALAPEKRHIVLSAVEHPSLLLLARHLEASGAARVTYLGVDADGRLDLDALARAITPDTALVSLMWANNESGVVFPIAEAAALVKSRGALFHTDAVQAAGKIALDVDLAAVDLLSLSGHKLHAAKGVGALYIRKGVKLPPLFFGKQERGRRGGTENLAAIVGFGVAADLAERTLATDSGAPGALRDRLEQGLLAAVPQARVNGGGALRLANTCNLRFGEVDAEIVLDRLDRAGVYASSGSACTAGGTEPSHVLLAMGQSRDEALAAVRFSLSRDSTPDEVERVLALVPGIVGPLLARPV